MDDMKTCGDAKLRTAQLKRRERASLDNNIAERVAPMNFPAKRPSFYSPNSDGTSTSNCTTQPDHAIDSKQASRDEKNNLTRSCQDDNHI